MKEIFGSISNMTIAEYEAQQPDRAGHDLFRRNPGIEMAILDKLKVIEARTDRIERLVTRIAESRVITNG